MMKNITDELKSKFTPKAMLIAYENEDSSAQQDKRYYLETRPIKDDGRPGPAKPVSLDFMRAIAKAYRDKEERTPFGPMPTNILYADSRLGKEKYVWWTPPMKRMMYFTEDIPMKQTTYNIPGTIYVAESHSFHVYCFEGRKPKPNSELLFGPFYNYYHDGGVCLGNARVEWPETITWKDILFHWEKMFWGSENSHMMMNPIVDNGNLNVLLEEAITKAFPTDRLQKTKMTLADLLK